MTAVYKYFVDVHPKRGLTNYETLNYVMDLFLAISLVFKFLFIFVGAACS